MGSGVYRRGNRNGREQSRTVLTGNGERLSVLLPEFRAMPDDSSDGKHRARRPGESLFGTGWAAKLVPRAVAIRSLDVTVRGPRTVRVGVPSTFAVRVSNRLPAPISIELPTARLWGWTIDDVADADDRGFSPPEGPRTVTFGIRERRQFDWTWDGTLRRRWEDGSTEWVPVPGVHTVTAYVAAADWERFGLYAETDVTVVE